MDAKKQLIKIITESKILKYVNKMEHYFILKREKKPENLENLYKAISGEDTWIQDKINELAQAILDAGFVKTEDMKNKDIIFIKHIQSHLKEGEEVICKICGKTAKEIITEAKGE